MAKPGKFQEFTETIRSEMQRLQIPGVSVGVFHQGLTSIANFGVTNSENPLPVDADTLFQIGSITKTFTATAVQCLVDAGLVDLDAPVRTWIPDLRLADPEVARAVTLRHILTHTGGWVGDYFDDAGEGDDALAQVVSRMDRLEQETPLGEIWSYNNSGFCLAGRVIEIIVGKPFETALHELLLHPLEMKRTFFFARDAITYRVSAGHSAVYPGQERSPEVLRPWWLARASNPAGGLLSTANDLLRYARFHLGDGMAASGNRILSEPTLKAMRNPRLPAGIKEWMGIVWFLHEIDGIQVMRHGGATNGQMALLQLVPAQQFALVILTNSDQGAELYQPLARKALQLYLGLCEPEPQPIQVEASDLNQYAGSYTSTAQDLILTIVDGSLRLQIAPKGGFPTPDSPPPPAPPATRLALCGVDQVLALDEPHKGDCGEFLRDTQGNLIWLRFSGRVHRRQ